VSAYSGSDAVAKLIVWYLGQDTAGGYGDADVADAIDYALPRIINVRPTAEHLIGAALRLRRVANALVLLAATRREHNEL
jgi:hypothetical protein